MGLFAVLFINYSRYAPWSEHDSGIIVYFDLARQPRRNGGAQVQVLFTLD
jgi:hypothetical protein